MREKLSYKVRMQKFNIQTITQQSWVALFLTIIAKTLLKVRCKRAAHYYAFLAASRLAEGSVSPILNSVTHSLIVNKYPKDKHADIYRDMAIELYRKDQLTLACAFIAKAKDIRPKGSRIIKLYDQFISENNTMRNSPFNSSVDKHTGIKNKVLGDND